jgi:hypothetical protein
MDVTNTVGTSCKFANAYNNELYVCITADLTVVSADFVKPNINRNLHQLLVISSVLLCKCIDSILKLVALKP